MDYACFNGMVLSRPEVIKLAQMNGLTPSQLNDSFWQAFTCQPMIERRGNHLRCQRCGNRQRQSFACLPRTSTEKERYYCLNCLVMGRQIEGQDLLILKEKAPIPIMAGPLLAWQGQLSPQQAQVSKELVESLKDPRPHLVQAVTGAGKTEMVFAVVEAVLQEGGRVALASPRVDVIQELAPRFKEAFPVVSQHVRYGGQSFQVGYAALILATTHQLWRFKSAFDLVIVDEIDAFPFRGDASLHDAVASAICPKGKCIYLTATPDIHLLKAVRRGKVIQSILPARYHRHSLVEPQFIWLGDWRQAIEERQEKSRLFDQVKYFVGLPGAKLIFMPHIGLAKSLFAWLKDSLGLKETWACVHAGDPERKEKVQALRSGDLVGLISTTILERGVTITQAQVLVIGAEDTIFNAASLVQIAGRVGRKPTYPTGYLAFGHYGASWAMKQARRTIRHMNQLARQRGLLDD
ncbi:DEAD/DEAH box helicase [Vaginisenegalia massiliensis]|uniref:DEAD/DEAH box helicase n=1 Tax=Vaginisenegalia massiliensis TaxID=2058294 RepID=UPI0013DDC71D|nr:DEAD/DEAH box helicase [Vaginisenegalia massiliensis]